MSRSAFTIIELLVSIGIFAISAALMLGAMFGATETFRRGEAARQSGDEATAVIAALQEDISRAVPSRLRDGVPAPEWGRLYAHASATGDCTLGMVVENPDRSQVRWIDRPGSPPSKALVGVRKWVFWQVIADPDPSQSTLIREEWDITEDGTIVADDGSSISFPTDTGKQPLRQDVVTRGCLHFGVWVELAEAHRLVNQSGLGPDIAWESMSEAVFPFANASAFDTRQQQGGGTTLYAPFYAPFYPQPDALRISLVLTGGGRFANRGYLVGSLAKDATEARVTGIKALPTTAGSLLRIGNEWVRYDDFRGGRITGLKRGELRSAQADPHPDRSLVLAGQPFSLVMSLPR